MATATVYSMSEWKALQKKLIKGSDCDACESEMCHHCPHCDKCFKHCRCDKKPKKKGKDKPVKATAVCD